RHYSPWIKRIPRPRYSATPLRLEGLRCIEHRIGHRFVRHVAMVGDGLVRVQVVDLARREGIGPAWPNQGAVRRFGPHFLGAVPTHSAIRIILVAQGTGLVARDA